MVCEPSLSRCITNYLLRKFAVQTAVCWTQFGFATLPLAAELLFSQALMFQISSENSSPNHVSEHQHP